jgi:hypothetical protein
LYFIRARTGKAATKVNETSKFLADDPIPETPEVTSKEIEVENVTLKEVSKKSHGEPAPEESSK